jgi:hypothetical protein
MEEVTGSIPVRSTNTSDLESASCKDDSSKDQAQIGADKGTQQ